ncbi:hypothetical protein ABE893_11240 [Enterococcus entomosocium]|uniref:hypothetical protein n=1 Tax=Enterococcus entomosocium TaxID=3034352 RepID=UPI003D6C3C9E
MMNKETFFLGKTNVTIENPVSYYPKTVNEEEIQRFLEKSSESYDNSFRELAEASSAFYELEKKLNSLEVQKEKVNQYLEVTAIKKIVKDTGISRTTIAYLKSGKRAIESTRLGVFEILVKYSNGLEKA